MSGKYCKAKEHAQLFRVCSRESLPLGTEDISGSIAFYEGVQVRVDEITLLPCPKCDGLLEAQDSFCRHCGVAFAKENTEEAKS